jgi:Bacterial PH domain
MAVTFSIGLAMLTIWVLRRLSATSLKVNDDVVEIRNPFRTTVLARSAMRRLSASVGGRWIVAETTDGRSIPIWAISSGVVWTLKERSQVEQASRVRRIAVRREAAVAPRFLDL